MNASAAAFTSGDTTGTAAETPNETVVNAAAVVRTKYFITKLLLVVCAGTTQCFNATHHIRYFV